MKEKIKTIILILIFIIALVVISLFTKKEINSNNQITKETGTVTKTETEAQATNIIIEVNETNFEEEVLNSEGKVLIDFYATWCGPCKTLKPILKEFANENSDIKVVEIDVDKCETLAEEYKIQAMPTLIVLENGKEINRFIGLISKDKIDKLCR